MEIKNYTTYLNEGKIINLFDFLNTFDNSVIAENELSKKLLGKTCVWYQIGNGVTLKKQTIGDIRIDGRKVYLNGYAVDQDYDIEIESPSAAKVVTPKGKWEQHIWEIIGIPSGEVIFVNSTESNKLLNNKLIEFRRWIKYKDKDYKNVYLFKDENYHKIKEFLDPKYKKPEKQLNYKKKDHYYVNDIVLCQGSVGHTKGMTVDLDMRVGKIIDMFKKPLEKDYSYLISFMNKFNPYLVNIGGEINKFCWWVKIENIKGEYTGDLESLKFLANVSNSYRDELEEHEIDDDYHIHQLFKGTDRNITYESKRSRII